MDAPLWLLRSMLLLQPPFLWLLHLFLNYQGIFGTLILGFRLVHWIAVDEEPGGGLVIADEYRTAIEHLICFQ